MKYLKPDFADHPLTSPRLKALVRAFYEQEALIAAWDAERLARKKSLPASPERALEDETDALLGELELITRTVARMERRIEKLRARRAKVEAAVTPAMAELSPADKALKADRLCRIAQIAEGGKPKGQTERAREMLSYLARTNQDEIRPVEITGHLRNVGHPVSDNYGAAMLHVWQKSGLVTRTGHGRYRIDRDHPDLMRAARMVH